MMPSDKMQQQTNGDMKGDASNGGDAGQGEAQPPSMARNASAGDTQANLPSTVARGLSFGSGGAVNGAEGAAKVPSPPASSHAESADGPLRPSGIPSATSSFPPRFGATPAAPLSTTAPVARPAQPRTYLEMATHTASAAATKNVGPSPASRPPIGGLTATTEASLPVATSAVSQNSQPPPKPPAPSAGPPRPASGGAPAAGGTVRTGLNQPRPGGPPAAPPSTKPPGAGGGMKELRVEDALLYLDDVKREFGHRPRVYNEFLAIMKNFKSQEVDTPGVIERVSKLFRGYNNLILGFNKFLPDGYKISLEDLEEQDRIRAEQARREAAPATGGEARPSPTSQLSPTTQQTPHVPPVPQHSQPPVGFPQQHQAQQTLPGARGASGASPPLGPGVRKGVAPPRGPTTVRSGQPYPPFKNQAAVDKMDHRPGQSQPSSLHQAPPSAVPSARPGLKASPPALPTHKSPPQPRPVAQSQHPPAARQPQPKAAVPSQQRPQPPAPAQPAQPQHQAVEFDHAISYVTTIKRRFANDPNTYHSFLEILHTYQKEQRGIKEVLEQVAHLFQDHPDLLKEFTFFLPDAIQEQAKERLHRAASESEARQAAERARQEQQQKHSQMKQSKERDHHKQSDDMEVDHASAGHQKFIDMTNSNGPVAEPEPSSRGHKRSHADATTANKEVQIPVTLPHQPESYVYNSAVERQFFDAAREALASYTRDGGQAWAEFLKCLDMYAQEILSRSEMLNFVEPLLGKRNTKLFEEFKRILGAAGAQQGSLPSVEDSWHSVPLSEIDFSRCRRCSPSYRALPRDYPAPPCSERSDEEAKVLNDVWVSLPVGSEESYTFRHMRRNTYEEMLFRCEDERFEIDMVIDSNIATLHRLEPIAEEIAQLAQEELVIPDNSNIPKPASEDAGMGGKRYCYVFDKKILGVIHRNSIARLYGEAGQEMLDLMVKNPTVAIPVVVERLRQKDKEWRVVRERLNRQWKDLVEHNYYKSLDHRSLTWRTTDKRAISTRTLAAEIKDRAAHGGNEGQAAQQVRMDKAKEEHGAFYETTMGESLTRQLDLTTLPKPDRRLFTPHLSLMYECNDWVQRDAYRILAFALERGSNISPADKERCHRLWIDFLGPWFGLGLNWMQQPAVAYQDRAVSKSGVSTELPHPSLGSNGSGAGGGDDSVLEEEDGDDSMDDDADLGAANIVTEDARKLNRGRPDQDESYRSFIDHHPLPAGSTVSTLYGQGRIIKFRKSDDTYAVRLPFGTAYLPPRAVLCTVIVAEKSDYTSQLRAEDRSKLERPDDMLVIGPQSLYLFFRLHQILVRRLRIAKQLAYSVKDDETLITLVEQMPGDDAAALGRRRYEAYLSLVYALIDGSAGGGGAEGGKYEDRVRCLLGHGAYELATMDKLISHILKNIQSMGNDDTMWNLIQLFRRHLDSGSFKPEAFRQEAVYLSDGEPMYAFQQCPVHKDGSAGNKSVLHMEYLGVISESDDEDNHNSVSGAGTDNSMDEPPHQSSKRQKRER